MKRVNYYILGRILGECESNQLQGDQLIETLDFDDVECIERLADDYLRPLVEQLSLDSQNMIRWSLAYFGSVKDAPFEALYEMSQELNISPPRNWSRFYFVLGEKTFRYRCGFLNAHEFQEVNDIHEAGDVFLIGWKSR